MENALIVDQFMAGTANVVDDFIATIFHDGLANATGEIVEHLVPRNAHPVPAAAFSDAFERIQNALRIGDLIQRRGALRAISSATSRMRGIAFELANLERLLVDICEQAASRLAVEANGRNYVVVILDFAGPMRGIIFDPVIPLVRWRKTREPLARRGEVQSCGIQRLRGVVQ